MLFRSLLSGGLHDRQTPRTAPLDNRVPVIGVRLDPLDQRQPAAGDPDAGSSDRRDQSLADLPLTHVPPVTGFLA